MIVSAAFCPAAPFLLPGLTGGVVAEVAGLRERSLAAFDAALDGDVDRIVVLGSSPRTGAIDAGLPAPDPGFRGRPGPAGPRLPVAHAVALGLLGDTSTTLELSGVDPSTPTDECLGLGRTLAAGSERTAVVVAADGSARRSAKGPGYLDPDAFAVDDAVLGALRHGDPAGLAELDAERCARQLVDGRAAWQVLAGATADRSVTPADVVGSDPYGVLYVTGYWRLS